MATDPERGLRRELQSDGAPQTPTSPWSTRSRPDDLSDLMGELTVSGIENQAKKIGLLYDERMMATHNLWVPTYPENPQRLEVVLQRCTVYGLIERCLRIQARSATESEILLQHSKEYYELVKRTAHMSADELKELSMKYDGVYFHPATFDSVMLAAGSAVEITEQIVCGKIRYGMALLRPPGHHALRDEPCGYCFFNNAAIAAKYAVDTLGLERVLLLDWDLHHGQASQYMFYEDPRVLYFSIHRYEYGLFWPNLRESDYDYIGGGKGRGFNVNVPFNKVDMTDGDYMAIMQQLLMPIAYEFSPQLVIVSCGFDAAIGDPEGRSEVTPACYAHFTHMIKQIAGDRLCILFEGGYCLKSLAEGAALTLRGLLDDPCPLLPSLAPPMDSTRESILQVKRVLRPYVHCFDVHDDAHDAESLPEMFRNIVIPKPDVTFCNESNRPEKYDLEDYEDYPVEEIKRLDKKIDLLISQTRLYTPPNRLCLVYDERMCQHRSTTNIEHPERPGRIRQIYSCMQDLGLVKRCKSVEARFATDEELTLIHSAEWVNKLRVLQTESQEDLEELEHRYESIYFSQTMFDCASLAVGSTLNVVDEVLSGSSRAGLAVVRPPGHHAEAHCAMGFCYFNTVAIAAKYSRTKHDVKRVLILDWDVHHGNGTQHVFEDDPSVLYISIHRRDDGAFFPGGPDNDVDKVGSGAGVGYNINIPWHKGGMGDAEYIAAFQQVVMPVAYEFAPDLVLVSAGFDAALGDPLGNCKVTPIGYGHMTHMLSGLAGGRVILVLEGGYNLSSISDSMSMCASVLLGDRLPAYTAQFTPKELALRSIREVLTVQEKHWRSLAFNVKMPSRQDTLMWLGDTTTTLLVQSIQASSSVDVKPTVAVASSDVHNLTTSLANIHVSNQSTASSSSAVKTTTASNSEASSILKASGVAVSGGAASGGAASGGAAAVASPGIHRANEEEGPHGVVPLPWCPHLHAVKPVPPFGLSTDAPCAVCGSIGENWVCLTCYEVHCSRFQKGHMVEHNARTQHPFALSYFDLSAWCYTCDAYVHNEALLPAKNSAHLDKFQIPG